MHLNVVVIDDARSISVRSGTEVDSSVHAFDAVEVQFARRTSLRGRARQRLPISRPPILAPSVMFRSTETTSRGHMPVQRRALVIMSRSFEPNIPVVVDSAYEHQCDCLYCTVDYNLTEFDDEENENTLQDLAVSD